MLKIYYQTSSWKILKVEISDIKYLIISDLEVDMTIRNKKLFDTYGNKITNSIIQNDNYYSNAFQKY